MQMEAPFRRVILGGEVWDLYADHRAWSVIELTTKRSYRRWLGRFLNKKSSKLEAFYLLLWGLSARYRHQSKKTFSVTDEDRAMGAHVPSSFLDLIPNSPEAVENIKLMLYELLAEAGLITYTVVEAPPVDGAAPPGTGQNPTIPVP